MMKNLGHAVALAAMTAFVLPGASAVAGDVQPLDVRARPADPGERVYYIGAGATVEDAVALRDRLIAAGAWNVNLFVQERVIVARVTPRVAAAVDVPAVFQSETEKTAQAPARVARESWGWIADAYRLVDRAPVGFEEGGGGIAPPFDDVLLTVPPERVREVQREAEKAMAMRGGAPAGQSLRSMSQNSEILTGSILANFIFPESDGSREPNRETWSDNDLLQAQAGAAGAFLAWQAWTQMDINTTFNMLLRVPTGYEPIEHDMNSDEQWLLDVMQSLGWGFHGGNSLGVVHGFNEDARATYRTQWVVTSFIAYARNTPNHRFGGGTANYTAYAYLGGPYMLEPFPAGTDPNNIGETLVFSKIVQHEIGHLFWTLDEYPGAPGTCGSSSGYLNYANGNISMTGPGGEVRCEALTPCIMHTATRIGQGRPWCRYSLGHLGVIDNNNNGYPDIFEAAPEIVFEPAGPETVTTNQFTLRFRAVARAVSNRNPVQDPATRVDYASPLSEVKFSLGSTVGIDLTSQDGRVDGLVEEFVVPIALGSVGQSAVVIRARNAVGFQSPAYSKQIYFTGVNYGHMAAAVKTSWIEVSWSTAGDVFGAAFDVYRLEPGEPLPGTLGPGEVPPGKKLNAAHVGPEGPGTAGFVSYRYRDFDIEPGHDYRYYALGSFTLPVEGGTREYLSPSQVVGQTAAIPVGATEFVSGIAPNPSTGNVTLSIQIPRTWGGSPQAPQRLATPVDVAVYDVRGRRIRVLEARPLLQDVLTLRWDGRSEKNVPVPAGIYFVRITAGDAEAVRKVVLLR